MDAFARTFMTATLLDREPRAVVARRSGRSWIHRLFGRGR